MGAESLQIHWGKFLEQIGDREGVPDSTFQKRSMQVAFPWSLAVWRVALWNGRSYSLILQVFIEHLLCTGTVPGPGT